MDTQPMLDWLWENRLLVGGGLALVLGIPLILIVLSLAMGAAKSLWRARYLIGGWILVVGGVVAAGYYFQFSVYTWAGVVAAAVGMAVGYGYVIANRGR